MGGGTRRGAREHRTDLPRHHVSRAWALPGALRAGGATERLVAWSDDADEQENPARSGRGGAHRGLVRRQRHRRSKGRRRPSGQSDARARLPSLAPGRQGRFRDARQHRVGRPRCGGERRAHGLERLDTQGQEPLRLPPGDQPRIGRHQRSGRQRPRLLRPHDPRLRRRGPAGAGLRGGHPAGRPPRQAVRLPGHDRRLTHQGQLLTLELDARLRRRAHDLMGGARHVQLQRHRWRAVQARPHMAGHPATGRWRVSRRTGQEPRLP